MVLKLYSTLVFSLSFFSLFTYPFFVYMKYTLSNLMLFGNTKTQLTQLIQLRIVFYVFSRHMTTNTHTHTHINYNIGFCIDGL